MLPVGGAYGGPAPDGSSVVAHLYSEFVSVPDIVVLPVQEDGRAGGEGEQVRRSDFTRTVLATIVMSPEVAQRVGTFLTTQGKAALTARGAVAKLTDAKGGAAKKAKAKRGPRS